MLAATLVGPGGYVLSAEANPVSVESIIGNAALNDWATVRVERVAVSERSGRVVFSNNGERDGNGAIAVDKTIDDASRRSSTYDPPLSP